VLVAVANFVSRRLKLEPHLVDVEGNRDKITLNNLRLVNV